MTKIPGITAKHAIITDQCRANRGDIGAFQVAMEQLRREYDAITRIRTNEPGVNYRLVLVVEDTKREKKVADDNAFVTMGEDNPVLVDPTDEAIIADAREYAKRDGVDRDAVVRRVMSRWDLHDEESAARLVDRALGEEPKTEDDQYRCAGELP